MNDFFIITDSTSDLRGELIKDKKIKIVPLKVMLNGKELFVDSDSELKRFYKSLEEKSSVSTSQPSIGDFVEIFKEVKSQGVNNIICIHISSELSNTLNQAKTASKFFEGINFYFIDSLSVSLGLGFLCLEAERILRESSSVKEAIERIEKMKRNFKVFFFVESLEFLLKGGRAKNLSAQLLKFFGYHFLLELKEGEIKFLKAYRNKEKIINRLKEEILPFLSNSKIGLMYSDYDKDILKELCNFLANKISLEVLLNPIISAHTGPKCVGIVIFKEQIS